MSRQASYQRRYFGRRGFSSLRYATSFAIWYGSKKILGPVPFPPGKRKVADREVYLDRKINNIERERQRILAERREKREKERKRKEREKKRKERERKKKIQAAKDEKLGITPEDRTEIDFSYSILAKERPVFSQSRQEEPQTLKAATIRDVTVTPIIPKNNRYVKELIDKIIYTDNMTRILALTILNYSLREEFFMLIEQDTFGDTLKRAIAMFIPHIVDFFKETKVSADLYILRIKFAFIPEGEKNFREQGLSLAREQLTSIQEVTDLFHRTFAKFLGQTLDSKGNLKKNYLVGATPVYITGFTFESSMEN